MEVDNTQVSPGKPNFDDSFDTSSSSSNENTPTSSPRATIAPEEEAKSSEKPMDIGSDAKETVVSSSDREDNWANFDSFNSTVDNSGPVVTSTSNEEQIAAADSSTSPGAEPALDDLDAGSPMAVTLQLSPGSTETAVTDSPAVSSSEDASSEKQDPVEDVVMDDVSTSLRPPEADSQTSLASDATETEPEPVSQEPERQAQVDMDTSHDESNVKRQRMETEACEADSASSGEESRAADPVDEEVVPQSSDVSSSSGGESNNVSSTQDAPKFYFVYFR